MFPLASVWLSVRAFNPLSFKDTVKNRQPLFMKLSILWFHTNPKTGKLLRNLISLFWPNGIKKLKGETIIVFLKIKEVKLLFCALDINFDLNNT